MAEPEPVKLRDLVHSLASIMVGTTRYLDQSAVDLQRLYGESLDGTLGRFTAPRFTLDAISVDLSFLVDEVVTQPDPPPAPTPAVELTQIRAALHTALRKLQAEDEAAFERWQQQLAAFQEAEKKWRRQVEASQFERQLRDLAQEEQRLRRQLSQGGLGGIAIRPQIQARLAEIAARRAEINVQNAQLQAERPVEPPAPPGVNGQDYVELWERFEAQYHAVKDWYVTAVAAFEAGQNVGPTPQQPVPVETIDSIAKRLDLSDAASGRVAELLSDRATVVTAVDRLLVAIAEAKGAGILVRVDPESIAEADEGALQHLQLTFRAEDQESVDVGGTTVEIPS